ncbi:hypothetical protein F2Q69_00052186 [Brassica cretica]|uniref:Uncharacterized protein n=1 Tax=Brassica cretica TaxID=69181 RepID=A0A8S9N3L0_BRACR|nr:hypothetical protein F2Q69_00052186 [Brassica cretica]
MELTSLPERMFAAGEEPTGDRVNTYHKQKRIKSTLDALEQEEKNPIKEKLYWGELFGSLKFFLVDTAIKKLQKKKIKDIEMRLKVTFEMLVTGIKKKDEISLSQASVALPGFVDAI